MLRLTQGSPPDMTLKAAIDVRKPTRLGEPEAVRGQRVADPRVVLMTQGPRKPGNGVEGKTLKTRNKAWMSQ